MEQKKALELLDNECLELFGCYASEATQQQIYRALCVVVRNLLTKKRKTFIDRCEKKEAKQVYYMSMEFLVGTSLHNNLYNLGLESTFANVLKKLKVDIHDLYKMEPDAGLGNGGLGRLASCYMDSATSLSMPVTGFSIR